MKKIIALLLLSLMCLSCGKKENKIQIGVVISLSGNGAQYGKMILDGMNLAIREINSQPGSTKYELLVEDDKTEPRDGINAIQKLIQVNKVKIIIGPIASSVALAVAPICELNKILMLSPAASTPKLTKAGDYIFRIYPSDDYDGSFLARFLFNRLEINQASILYLNNDFGMGLQEKFVFDFNSLGGKTISKESFNQGTTDFRSPLTIIKKDQSKALLLIATLKEYSTILRQMKELGIKRQVIAPVTFDDPQIIKLSGDASEGVCYSRPLFNPFSNDVTIKNFVDLFKKQFGSDPSILHALGYDSVKLIHDKCQSNELSSRQVKDIFYQMTTYSGASGGIKFDSNGDVIKDLEIMIVKKSKAIPFTKLGDIK